MNVKALALTVQKLLARLKFSKIGLNSKVKVTGEKIMLPSERSYHKDIKALEFTVQMLLPRLKFQRGGQNDKQVKKKQWSPRSLILGV